MYTGRCCTHTSDTHTHISSSTTCTQVGAARIPQTHTHVHLVNYMYTGRCCTHTSDTHTHISSTTCTQVGAARIPQTHTRTSRQLHVHRWVLHAYLRHTHAHLHGRELHAYRKACVRATATRAYLKAKLACCVKTPDVPLPQSFSFPYTTLTSPSEVKCSTNGSKTL